MVRRMVAAGGLAGGLVMAALTLTALPSSESEAATGGGPTFVIPANDGYGVAACIEAGSTCGQVVADAWCEAQGFAKSASYGLVDPETTGSIGDRRPISVTCAP